jgi:hypothetical protein
MDQERRVRNFHQSELAQAEQTYTELRYVYDSDPELTNGDNRPWRRRGGDWV